MTSRHKPLHRTDSTAKALIAAAKQFGWAYAPQDGTIDGTLWQPSTGRVELIDFKGVSKELTPGQQRLMAAGWPVRFVPTLEVLHALLRSR